MVGTRVYSHNGKRIFSARLSKDSDRKYAPLFPPVADHDELAAEGDRVMLLHGDEGPEIRTAKKGELMSGWAIGLLEPAQVPAAEEPDMDDDSADLGHS